MGSSSMIKNIGIGVVVLIVIGGAYIFLVGDKKTGSSPLTKDSSASSGITSTNVLTIPDAPELTEVRDIVSILNQLKTISIDDAIFKDPAFMALTDFHREISPQPKGRENPFLPGEGVRTSAPQTISAGR